MPSKTPQAAPRPGLRWVKGAEPVAVCMSCNGTFSPETPECPQCQVGLSLMRRCPSCERTQSANHLACIYCSTSFVREASFAPVGGPGAREVEVRHWYRWLALAGAISVASTLAAIYWFRLDLSKPEQLFGQSYVLTTTSLRARPAPGAPPVKDVQSGEVVSITGLEIDSVGNRWFEIRADEMKGYLQTAEVAPPKGNDPERTFEALRHSLLGLNEPSQMTTAVEAVDLYRQTFVDNPHGDEVAWLLAERARALAERSGQHRPTLLRVARTHYELVAKGKSDFAPRAQTALNSMSAGGPAAERAARAARGPAPLEFSVLGGESTEGRAAANRVRRVMVRSRTLLTVRLEETATTSPGRVIDGTIAEDVRVEDEIAIPRGSRAVLRVTEDSARLELTSLEVGQQTQAASGTAERVILPDGSVKPLTGERLPEQFELGSRVELRLRSPFVVGVSPPAR